MSAPIVDLRKQVHNLTMNSHAIVSILIGAVVADAIGVALFDLTAHLFVTGIGSPWVLLAMLALLGGSVGGLTSLIRRKQ